MSTYVLAKVLGNAAERFQELCADCTDANWRYALAELNSLLSDASTPQLKDAVAHGPTARLSPHVMNYLAAMVEQACAQHTIKAPQWTRDVPPPAEPAFGSALVSLRLYLLINSPPPFRRRNIFIDSSVGKRV